MTASGAPPLHPAPGAPVCVLLACVLGAIYLASVPVTSDAQVLGNDVFPYARALAAGELAPALDPHHLGHHLLAWLVMRATLAATGGAPDLGEALAALRFVSALGGGLCAAILWRTATALCGRASGAWLALGFAGAAGPWLYSAVGETYMPAAAAMAAWLGAAVLARARGAEAGLGLLAGGLALACVLRQDSVWLTPALFFLASWRRAVLAATLAGAGSFVVYLAAWAYAAPGPDFVSWLRGLLDTGLWGGGIDPSRLGVAAGVQQMALHYGMLHGGGWAVVSLATTALLVGAALAARGPVRRLGVPSALAALGLVAAIRVVFFTWWQPSNMEYHTPTLVPVFLALAVWTGRSAGAPGVVSTAVGFLAAFSLWLGNSGALIEPNRSKGLHARSVEAFQVAGPGGLVVALDPYQGFALERARPPGAALEPASAPGHAYAADRARLVTLGADTLERGERIVLVRDTLLFPRLGLPLHQVDGELIATLVGLADSETRSEQDGGVWQMILERSSDGS